MTYNFQASQPKTVAVSPLNNIVARTGEAEINQSHRIKEQDMVVQRISIKKDGKVIAVETVRRGEIM